MTILPSVWIGLINECHDFSHTICCTKFAMFNSNSLCLDSISFPCWLDLIIPVLQIGLIISSGDFSELSLITYYLFIIPYSFSLFFIWTPIFSPSPPLEIWWKTLRTKFQRIWLVRTKPHASHGLVFKTISIPDSV